LVRCKTEAAKVASAEREKKKTHDPSPASDLEKVISKKRVASMSEDEKCVIAEERRRDDEEPAGKRRGSIRSRRQTRTSISCQLPGFSPRHITLRKGKH
jgi:hypothetical protein